MASILRLLSRKSSWPSGCGKTTLFNAITGDFPPTAGRIHFFGEDITELPPHERIRKGLAELRAPGEKASEAERATEGAGDAE